MDKLLEMLQQIKDAGGDRVNELDCWVDDFSGNIVIEIESLTEVITKLNES